MISEEAFPPPKWRAAGTLPAASTMPLELFTAAIIHRI